MDVRVPGGAGRPGVGGKARRKINMVTNMRVLIGYDGSECAEAAVYDLHRAGLPSNTEAVVMTSADVSPHLPASCYDTTDPAALAKEPAIIRAAHILARAALEEARSMAARGAERVRAEFPAWKVDAEAAGDYAPYRALVQKADKWRPDLLVVGSHGRSAAGRAVFGSVSQNVLSHAICSVRIARFREDAGRLAGDPVRLVLGIDGSNDSAAAVSAVADRVWPLGSEVLVVMAVDPHLTMALAYGPQFGMVAWPAGGDGGHLERARHIAQSVADELKRSGLSAVPIVQEDDPKQVLLREADRSKADCIFVGAKGHSRLERFLLGSVSTAIATRARCSVEVIRQG